MKLYVRHRGNRIAASTSIRCTEEDDSYELGQVDQEYDSAATSINSKKLPVIYNMVTFNPGDVVIDYGGGKFDNAVNYLADQDVTLLVYDPYNRSAEHNREVLKTLRQAGGADSAVCSNVLNVIKEPEARINVLQNIKKLVRPGGHVYITVYEGAGNDAGGPTKSGYQLNRKTSGYMDEVQSVFPNAKRKGKLIVATNTGNASVDSATSIPGPGDYNPPEYDDPSEMTDVDIIDLMIDTDIIVDSTGQCYFEDAEYIEKQCDDSATWYSEEFPDVVVDYADGVADKILALLEDNITQGEGKYHVTGEALLEYEISDVAEYGNEDEVDKFGNYQEHIVDSSAAQATYNPQGSQIQNLKIVKLQ